MIYPLDIANSQGFNPNDLDKIDWIEFEIH
jgi:hypothetical protein